MTPEDKERIKGTLQATAQIGYMINKVAEHCRENRIHFEEVSEAKIFDIVAKSAAAFVAKSDKSDAMFEAFVNANT